MRRNRKPDEFDPRPRPSASSMLQVLEFQILDSVGKILEELGTGSGGGLSTGRCTGTEDDNVPGSEIPWELATIADIRQFQHVGEQCVLTPWGENAYSNRSHYIVDTGHQYVVKPRDEQSGGGATSAVSRIEDFLEQWMSENGWHLRQAEVSRRLDEHGECFDLLFYDEDGMVRLGFVEPQDLDEDPRSDYVDIESDKPFADVLGIRRTNNVLYRPVAYFVDGTGDPAGSMGQWLGDLAYHRSSSRREGDGVANFQAFTASTRSLLMYRRRNVLSKHPRGLTEFWPVRQELRWSKTLLSNLMRVSAFQAAFGAIRTIASTQGRDAVQNYLNSAASGTAGQSPERMDYPSPAVVTIPGSVKYEFPETGAGNSNHIELVDQLLRACASGLKLPEFMLTSNVSNGNFASTLVSEGPFHKAIRTEQARMRTEDQMVIDQAIRYAARSGNFGISLADYEAVVVETKLPNVQTRNRKEDWDIHLDAWKAGRISGKTLNASQGWEYAEEQQQRQREQPAELPPPLSEHPSTLQPPGPAGRSQSDGMTERNVSAGDPTRREPRPR